MLRLAWFVGRNGEPLLPTGANGAAFNLVGGTFKVGDVLRVRVQVSDRDLDRSRRQFAACPDDGPCAASSGCPQRVTWTVTYQ
jgi:hypothetical protein